MRTAKVTVVPYDPAWPAAFEAIRQELAAALGALAQDIVHVGSTSVEGMWAKPCIDVDVVIEDRAALAAVIPRLAAIGYLHEGDLGIAGREAFCYSHKPHLYRHHLYVCAKDCAELHRHRTFRDYLRSHPQAVLQYSRVKQATAARFPDDIDGYIAAKSPCIAEIYALCGLQQPSL